MKIGVIREGKVPPDSRVPLIPSQIKQASNQHSVTFKIQPSPGRCFEDEQFRAEGLTMTEDLSDCEVMMGVKEVPIDQLVSNKTYFFFSHTIKEQPYNRPLLLAMIEKNIRMIDYEALTDSKGKRLIAFGRFAGMVGAHNGVMTYGMRTGKFELDRMKNFYDYAAAKEAYAKMEWPKMRIVLTGNGRVGNGAAEVLDDMGIKKVSPEEYLLNDYDEAVYCQLQNHHQVARKDGTAFVKADFYENPKKYESIFEPFTKVSDIMINGIYWDNDAPAFFTKAQMRAEDFAIKVIADVTCDIAPVSSIPSTLFASTIADPIFGYNPVTEAQDEPFQDHVIDMMTIDNLPNEMPRDASTSFGEQFLTHILPELLKEDSEVIKGASICANGDLTPEFEYLRDYVNG